MTTESPPIPGDAEVFAPERTAVIVVDLQNDYAHPEGRFAASGADVSPVTAILPAVGAFVDAAREAGVLVVWIKQTTLPDGRSDSPAWLAFKRRNGGDGQYTFEGTWGHELAAPLAARREEPVVRKFRSSAFVNTDLDLILRAGGIESVVVCGCMTEGCLISTVRSASMADYYTGVAEDLVASRAVIPAAGECATLASLDDLSVERFSSRDWQSVSGFAVELLDVGDVSLLLHPTDEGGAPQALGRE